MTQSADPTLLSAREAALLKVAQQISESADDIFIEVSDQVAEYLREIFDDLDAALAAYPLPPLEPTP